MLETYQQEISRKRKAARIFWLIVFLFAGFLYFFFQGYYPAIDFSFRQLGLRDVNLPKEPRDLIRSFGIINVSVKPADAEILLGSGSYNNDEKRMTDYGEYTLTASHESYIESTVEFTIDRETPYYIDILTLLPRLQYERIGTGMTSITKIGTNTWVATTATGVITFDGSLSGATSLGKNLYTSIGEGYFLSGKTLVTYDSIGLSWESTVWSGSTVFLKNCKSGMRVKQNLLWCPNEQKILTEKGKTLNGIISIGNGYIEKGNALLVGENFSEVLPFGTGYSTQEHLFIEKESMWYRASGSSLVPLSKGTIWKKTPPLLTPLDSLIYAHWVEGTLALIGKKGENTVLTFYEPRNEKFSDPIIIPDISLEDILLEKRDGNIFFKTSNALLFLYHNSVKFEWLVEGKILAFGREGVLYEKDGIVWKATWEAR